MEAQFNHKWQLAGARIVSYLLEKTRVTKLCPEERSFHIFYQMCAGLPEPTRSELGIKPALHFHYLTASESITLPGVDDAQEFEVGESMYIR